MGAKPDPCGQLHEGDDGILMALQSLRSRVQTLDARHATAPVVADRMRGRALQDRRLRIWSRDPHCVDCGKLTQWPHGFELDHEAPLHLGGADSDENSRVRCVYYDAHGRKQGCHQAKSDEEARQRA